MYPVVKLLYNNIPLLVPSCVSISGCSTFLEGSKDSNLRPDSRAQYDVLHTISVFDGLLKSNLNVLMVSRCSQSKIASPSRGLRPPRTRPAARFLVSSLLLTSLQLLWPS